MGGFEGLELAHERVVLGVGHLGVVEDVVPVGMPADLTAQLLIEWRQTGRISLGHFWQRRARRRRARAP